MIFNRCLFLFIVVSDSCVAVDSTLFFSEAELALIRTYQKGEPHPSDTKYALSALSYQNASSWFFVLNGEVISSETQDNIRDYEILEVTPLYVTLKVEDVFVTLHPHQEYRIEREP